MQCRERLLGRCSPKFSKQEASRPYISTQTVQNIAFVRKQVTAVCKNLFIFSLYGLATAFWDKTYLQGVFFRMVPPQKVLSVEDDKIPTKKVKVRVKT